MHWLTWFYSVLAGKFLALLKTTLALLAGYLVDKYWASAFVVLKLGLELETN